MVHETVIPLISEAGQHRDVCGNDHNRVAIAEAIKRARSSASAGRDQRVNKASALFGQRLPNCTAISSKE
jgi:hypothetical protein